MVKGIEIFREFFKDFANNYVLIGGAACDEHFTEAGLTFRATKDLDIILIVEALGPDFVKRFWQFVQEGKYENKQKSTGKRKYYRFYKPDNKSYPFQLELFARTPDILDLSNDSHLTPIPVDEDLSSLSAILMEEEYYRFTIENSLLENNLHYADTKALICLKAKAFLDMKTRKQNGEQIDERNIGKHKKDIIRLAVLLSSDKPITLPKSIKNDMQNFIRILKSEPADYNQIGKNLGIGSLNGEELIWQIIQVFSL